MSIRLSAFCSVCTLAIGKNVLQDSIGHSTGSDSTSKRTRSVFFGLTYGNNSSFLGRYQAERLPYLSADVSYKSKTDFWASVLAYDIGNSASLVDEVDVMGGWSHDLSKRVDASVLYMRYFFTQSTELIKSSVANAAYASIGLDWGFLYSKLGGYYIFGGGSDFFLVLDNSRYLEFPDLFRKGDYLSVEPKISIISGSQTFVDRYYISRGMPLSNSRGNGQGSGRGNGPPWGGGTSTGGTSTVESVRTTFDILAYEFSLPVAYGIGRFSFEVTGRYSIPVNLLVGDTSVPQFFFTGGVVYSLSGK